MSTILVHRLLFAAAIAAVYITASPALSKGPPAAIVVASTTPGFVPGSGIDPAVSLLVPGGTMIVVMLRSGEMLRVRGPFEGTLAPDKERQPALALVEALRLRGTDASVIGGARSAARKEARAREVNIPRHAEGVYCLVPDAEVWLTTDNPPVARELLILARGGQRRELAWPAGAQRIEWPQDVAIENGDAFVLLSSDERATLGSFKMRLLGTLAESEIAATLAFSGCKSQAEKLLPALRESVPAETSLQRAPAGAVVPGKALAAVAQPSHDGELLCIGIDDEGGGTVLHPTPGTLAAASAGVPVALIAPAGKSVASVSCFLPQNGAALPEGLAGNIALDAGTIAALERHAAGKGWARGGLGLE
jgi:hypothetical protein